MKYRLLLDIEAFDFLASQTRADRTVIRRRLQAIYESPAGFVDFQEEDENGRLLDVHLHHGFAIYFWDDFADRHLKIMKIARAGS